MGNQWPSRGLTMWAPLTLLTLASLAPPLYSQLSF